MSKLEPSWIAVRVSPIQRRGCSIAMYPKSEHMREVITQSNAWCSGGTFADSYLAVSPWTHAYSTGACCQVWKGKLDNSN
jgi:hypothetical protein